MAIQTTADEIRALFPEVEQIEDPDLRDGVIDIWLDLARETAWERFEDIPKNLKEEKHMTLIGHVQGVIQMALAMADIAERLHGVAIDRDLLIASCILHDISKPLESTPNPGGPPTGSSVPPGKITEFGEKIQHGVYGAHKIWAKGLPMATELAHLVITHTRTSNTRSNSYEAALLFYADWADSDAGIVLGGDVPFSAKWVEK